MSDVEHRLGSYRPAGPPTDLRMRITQATKERSPLRAWLPALAAAALALIFYALGVTTRASIASRLRVAEDLRLVEQWLPQADRGRP